MRTDAVYSASYADIKPKCGLRDLCCLFLPSRCDQSPGSGWRTCKHSPALVLHNVQGIFASETWCTRGKVEISVSFVQIQTDTKK